MVMLGVLLESISSLNKYSNFYFHVFYGFLVRLLTNNNVYLNIWNEINAQMSDGYSSF